MTNVNYQYNTPGESVNTTATV